MELLQSTITLRKPQIVEYDEIRLERDLIHRGHLILVNREHPVGIPDIAAGMMPLHHLKVIDSAEQGISLEKTCLQQLTALLKACYAMENIVVVSGYRSVEEQRQIYDTSLAENGAVFTASYVARPNESEHQTGLAVDVGENVDQVDFICPSFPDNGICLKFKQLAAEYGFIQRYKEGKEHITNIACEPWHFRYVGFPHSVLIEQHGFCLEEYIEFLKSYTFNHEHLYIEHVDSYIEIYYVPAEEGVTKVPVTKGEKYHLSGNNQNGFVVTVFHAKGSESSDF